MKAGDKVIYTGCTIEQQRWGTNDSPKKKGLIVGNIYEVDSVEVHTWHSKVTLKGIDGRFNSVCFDTRTSNTQES